MLSSLSTDISGEGDDMQVFLEVLNILRELDISIVKKKNVPPYLLLDPLGVIHKPCGQGMGMGFSIVLITTKAKVFE